jgi:hypothetical protein
MTCSAAASSCVHVYEGFLADSLQVVITITSSLPASDVRYLCFNGRQHENNINNHKSITVISELKLFAAIPHRAVF